jgi:hypothetical protein
VLNQVVLNQVILRFGTDASPAAGDALTEQTIAAVQADGTCFAGGARWRERWVMRLSVIGHGTTEADAIRSADAIARIWQKIRSQE